MTNLHVGSVHKTNLCGDLVITKYSSSRNVQVRFIETGSVRSVPAHHIINGTVKDLLKPAIYGVGFFGEGPHTSTVNGRITQCYEKWRGMIRRCYDKKFQIKNPAYVGCSVCVEWHNFQNFADWFVLNYPQDGQHYELDKDIKVSGNKVYSPETCAFVSQTDNKKAAFSKSYEFISPAGNHVSILNLSDFCRKNSLCQGHMVQVSLGKLNQHKGWRAVPC